MESLEPGYAMLVYMQKMTFNEHFDEDDPLTNDIKFKPFLVKVMLPINKPTGKILLKLL